MVEAGLAQRAARRRSIPRSGFGLSKNQCERCGHIAQRVAIELPSDLTRILKAVREALNEGVLEDISLPGSGLVPFAAVSDTGPWDDILSYRFRCAGCGAEYRLSCDTYHGGGEWVRE